MTPSLDSGNRAGPELHFDEAMAKNRVFFPQEALDRWLVSGEVELVDNELTIRSEGRKYRVVEAVRVLTEVSGAPDPNEIAGRVKTVAFLSELGAELLGGSMIIGENAYEVVPGWLGSPIGSFAEHRVQQAESTRSGPSPSSDEELLAQFLVRHL